LAADRRAAGAAGPKLALRPASGRLSFPATMNVHAKFETGLQVRPDDIDLFQHVHSSRYMDYVLAARYDQMARCYGMSWEEFIRRGLGWYLTGITMDFLRPLSLGDHMVVRTWIEDFLPDTDGVRVRFEIEKQETGKRCVQGRAEYKLINLATNRAIPIPEDIKAKYSI
jgi:thioesterase III